MRRAASKIDKAVGQKIRVERQQRGMSQTDLGEAVGVSFQQIQKYEIGRNRISVGNLCEIARALSVRPEALLP